MINPLGNPAAKQRTATAPKDRNQVFTSVVLRHDFYKNVADKMTRIATAASLVAGASILSAAAIILFRAPPQNYAVYPDGRLVPMEALSEGESQSAVVNLAAETITSSFSFDFKNYNRQLGALRSQYTEDGYNNFMTAVEPLLTKVKEGNFVAFSALTQSPVIVKSGVVNGSQMYKIQTVVMVSMEGQAKRLQPEQWAVEVVVTRVPKSKYPLGLAVSRLVAKPYTH